MSALEARHYEASTQIESDRYAAEKSTVVLLQAKARSFHLLPALCASLVPADYCATYASMPNQAV